MKKFIVALFLGLIILHPTAATCEQFSLFGVKMAMTREEVDAIWSKLPSGEYNIEGSVLFNIKVEFDFRDRLNKLSFSVPITGEHPSNLVATAYQRLMGELWGDDPTISLSVRSGKGVLETTVSSKTLQDEYIEHIMLQLKFLFKP